MNPLPLTDADLNAYVDGRLPPARLTEVEGLVAQDAALAARVDDLRRQNATLHEAFDPWLDEPIPQHLLAAATAAGGARPACVAPRRISRRRRRW